LTYPSFQTSWKSIEPDSSVTHEIVVKPNKAGPQNITSAVLNYRPSSGKLKTLNMLLFLNLDSDETIRGFSSDYGVANIIPENEFLRNHASHGIVSSGFRLVIFSLFFDQFRGKN
jgi:translocon-associated protein subunit beta